MSLRRAALMVGFGIHACASCSGTGPYWLGENRFADAGGEAADSGVDGSVADALGGDRLDSDGSVDAAMPASILCGDRQEPCEDDEFCDFSDTACGTTDVVGQCLPRPELSDCPSECNPVCGCDGLTYCNECFAHVAGFDRKLPCP